MLSVEDVSCTRVKTQSNIGQEKEETKRITRFPAHYWTIFLKKM